MRWFLGGLILTSVALLLRRVLKMGVAAKAPANRDAALRPELEAIYRPLAQEIEAHTAILGITLNDAFNERDEDRQEMAWRVIRLAFGEWVRLTELIVGVQNLLAKFLPTAHGIVLVRRISAGHFRSRQAIDAGSFYEFLDQVIFSSKRRFSLRLRLLSRIGVLLSKEFRRACREGERTLDSSEELWSRLDYYFHDFDLIAKETLLALQTLLICQSPEDLQELRLDLRALLERGVRVSVSPSHQ